MKENIYILLENNNVIKDDTKWLHEQKSSLFFLEGLKKPSVRVDHGLDPLSSRFGGVLANQSSCYSSFSKSRLAMEKTD